jgi:hypothetical protein
MRILSLLFLVAFLCSCAYQYERQNGQVHQMLWGNPPPTISGVYAAGPRFMPIDGNHLAESLELMQLEQMRAR